MPVIKSAKKKLRQDRKKETLNANLLTQVKKLIKKAKKEMSEKTIIEAVKRIDKAAKKGVFHKNKAARLKSQLSKITKKTPVKAAPAKKSRQSKKAASK